MTNQTFSVVGITDYKDGFKVRFTNDMCRRIKRCSKNGANRLDFVDLPHAMTKVEALKYMLTLPQFQSPEDQVTIEDALASRDKDARISKEKPRRGRPPFPKTTLKDIMEAING